MAMFDRTREYHAELQKTLQKTSEKRLFNLKIFFDSFLLNLQWNYILNHEKKSAKHLWFFFLYSLRYSIRPGLPSHLQNSSQYPIKNLQNKNKINLDKSFFRKLAKKTGKVHWHAVLCNGNPMLNRWLEHKFPQSLMLWKRTKKVDIFVELWADKPLKNHLCFWQPVKKCFKPAKALAGLKVGKNGMIFSKLFSARICQKKIKLVFN